jgi:hypothetical protein
VEIGWLDHETTFRGPTESAAIRQLTVLGAFERRPLDAPQLPLPAMGQNDGG